MGRSRGHVSLLRPEPVDLPGCGRRGSSWGEGGLCSSVLRAGRCCLSCPATHQALTVPSAASELGGKRLVLGNGFADTGLVIVDFGARVNLEQIRDFSTFPPPQEVSHPDMGGCSAAACTWRHGGSASWQVAPSAFLHYGDLMGEGLHFPPSEGAVLRGPDVRPGRCSVKV